MKKYFFTHHFIYYRICKKTKNHKTHDWSRLVRQKLDEWDGELLYYISKTRFRME